MQLMNPKQLYIISFPIQVPFLTILWWPRGAVPNFENKNSKLKIKTKTKTKTKNKNENENKN